jgi:beta-lactamase superfamily II metal-dependent hydrolase
MKSNDWQIDPSLDPYGILSKLLFNESSARVTEGMLRLLGFVHLYTASGIHLYALLDAIEKLGRGLTSFLGVRAFQLKSLGQFAGMALLAYLWSLQSYRIGFARPILIFLIRTFARKRGMKWRLFYPLLITFLLDVLLQIESGRLHYYLAVGGGLLGMDWAKQRKMGGFAEHGLMAVGSWFFTALVDLVSHHTIAWMTPVWSLLTIPLISLVLYPLTIGAWIFTHSIPQWLSELWTSLMDVCVRIVDWGFTFSLVTPSSVWIGFIFSVLALLILIRVKDLRFRLVWISLGFLVALSIQTDDSRVVQFDVKQGDSLLIQKQGRIEMVDAGSEKAWPPDQWIQKLSLQGIDHVDAILLSHLDEDHVGGLLNLVPFVPIGVIQTHPDHWKSEKGLKFIQKIRDRSRIRLSGKNNLKLMRVAWFQSHSDHAAGNELMAGVVAPLDEQRVYVGLGDGDESQEALYLDYFKTDLQNYPVRIWKAGHHGSKYSSGMSEMLALHPSKVWISVGKKNRYHHPTVEAMSRLRSLQVPLQRTDEEGDLVEKINQSFFDKITG